ncbi:MAG: hypothetical protein LBT40_02605 [Deltaproteobacteria bacterium]|nr:hypothetical protein [Deltaproteobacteria bacterium]
MSVLVRFSATGKLAAFLMAAAGAEIVAGLPGRLALTLAMAVCLAVQGLRRRAVFYLAFCAAALSLLEALKALAMLGIDFSPFYLFTALKLAAPVMAAEALARSEPGEICAFMSVVRLGPRARLAALVALRAFPAVLMEAAGVLESMRSRGALTLRGTVSRPLRTLETLAVPVFLRLLTVSDQLAASAQARGAGRPGRCESYCPLRPGLAETAVLGILAVAVLASALLVPDVAVPCSSDVRESQAMCVTDPSGADDLPHSTVSAQASTQEAVRPLMNSSGRAPIPDAVSPLPHSSGSAPIPDAVSPLPHSSGSAPDTDAAGPLPNSTVIAPGAGAARVRRYLDDGPLAYGVLKFSAAGVPGAGIRTSEEGTN